MSAEDLRDKVKARISEQKLKDLTTNDPSETTINDSLLLAACQDAIGEFQRIVGISEDTENNPSHVSLLVQGVLYFLENYKSRENAIMSLHSRSFYAGCNNFSEKRYIDPSTNSKIIKENLVSERSDMDRSKIVFASRSNRGARIRQSFADGE